MASEPRIVAFLCNWCAYQAADRAGQAKLSYPHSLLTVRVMCTGRVEPAFVLQAFREGADGVLVAGCHPGDCHYVDGNLKAAARHEVLSRALAEAGIEPARFRIAWASATEAAPLAALVRSMTEELKALGARRGPPLRRGEGPSALDQAPPLPNPLPRLTPFDRLRVSGEGAREWSEAPLAPRGGERGRGEGRTPRRKPRVAFYWNASCGGCDEAIVDLDGFGALLERVEIVLWPVALDFKREDVEALPDGDIDVAFVNGAIRVAEQEEWARLLRRKARVLVAFGACAHLGGVVGLGNLAGRGALLDTAYRRLPSVSNPGAALPGQPVRVGEHELSVPALLPATLPLEAVVPVDCTLPGCPPSPALVAAALDRLLSGDLPPRGSVLAPNAALCETCPRKASRPERIEIGALRRLATSGLDPQACFLAQGLVCAGPATRQGCQPGCLEVGMPCRGCFGPLDGVRDGGAAMLSAFASLLAGGEAEVRALGAALPDPAGTFWRYGCAVGLPPRRPGAGTEEGA